MTVQGSTANVGIGTSSPAGKLHVSGNNGPLRISGTGYIINPSEMTLGQYTSTRGYIQMPGGNGGQIEIWNGGTSNPVTFNNYGIGLNGYLPTNGMGITFPSVQSASSDANTLDDYEEGSWTPNQGSGLVVVGAFSSSGTYTKVGRQVTVIFSVSGATTIAVNAGGIITGNLPFTSTTSFDNAGTVFRFGASGGQCISGSSSTNVYNGAAIGAGGGLSVSITYFV